MILSPLQPTLAQDSPQLPTSWVGKITVTSIGAALIIIPPTLFSPGVAAPLQNMLLRAQTHMGRPALSGFVIKADRGPHPAPSPTQR